jgi:hypothetical protein
VRLQQEAQVPLIAAGGDNSSGPEHQQPRWTILNVSRDTEDQVDWLQMGTDQGAEQLPQHYQDTRTGLQQL